MTILPCLSKLNKKIIVDRLFSFLLKYNILANHKLGFMPGKYTTRAILSIPGKYTTRAILLVDYLENYKFTCGIFLVISKAFHTINHNILLSKLHVCYKRKFAELA